MPVSFLDSWSGDCKKAINEAVVYDKSVKYFGI